MADPGRTGPGNSCRSWLRRCRHASRISRSHTIAEPQLAANNFRQARGRAFMKGDISNELSAEQIQQRIEELGPWFHNINLCGVNTAPEHFLGDYPAIKWKSFAEAIPDDL